MVEGLYDETLAEFRRRGDTEKAKWLEDIERHIQLPQRQRIQQNDKTVLKEIVLPKWLKWEVLYSWAMKDISFGGRRCALCNEESVNYIDFRSKAICERCFMDLKSK